MVYECLRNFIFAGWGLNIVDLNPICKFLLSGPMLGNVTLKTDS